MCLKNDLYSTCIEIWSQVVWARSVAIDHACTLLSFRIVCCCGCCGIREYILGQLLSLYSFIVVVVVIVVVVGSGRASTQFCSLPVSSQKKKKDWQNAYRSTVVFSSIMKRAY